MKIQHGSTLVIVLIILLLITIIGTIAIRSSILGLGIATNNQINTLLQENTDAALFNIEDPDRAANQLALGGMFAYFNVDGTADDEQVFCYKASRDTFFNKDESSIITSTGAIENPQGLCSVSEFATGRSAVLSQVYITKSKIDEPFKFTIKQTSVGESKIPGSSLGLHASVISILPSFSNATDTEIQTCFEQGMNDVIACFEALNIPYNMQSIDFNVAGQPQQQS